MTPPRFESIPRLVALPDLEVGDCLTLAHEQVDPPTDPPTFYYTWREVTEIAYTEVDDDWQYRGETTYHTLPTGGPYDEEIEPQVFGRAGMVAVYTPPS